MNSITNLTYDHVLEGVASLDIDTTWSRLDATVTAVHILIQEGGDVDNIITDTELCEKVANKLRITPAAVHSRIRSFKKDFIKRLPEDMQDRIIPVHAMLRGLLVIVISHYLLHYVA